MSMSSTALRISFEKHRLAHFFGSILIWPTSVQDNMTSSTINRPWVWLLVFCAGGSKTVCTCLGVALGIGFCGRPRAGVSGGATAGGATSWVMSGGGLHGVIGDVITASIGYAPISHQGASSSKD